ncbi:DUF4238 domain-containing protein [Candidatus Bathyarchaeota archaeon]|nr:DUF4238 domain-containing protein [Candidatus Bathyarchaeota archaeon]
MVRGKSEHYVPQFYLKNFTIGGKGKTLHCFDKATLKEFISTPKNVACGKHFYDAEPSEQSVENFLSKIEADFSVAYNKLIIERDLRELKLDEVKNIATFIVLQELRTREWRETLRDLVKQLNERLSKYKMSDKLKEELEDVTREEYPKEMQLGMMSRYLGEFVEMMLGTKWILIENGTQMLFWTSDQPVTRYNPVDKSPLGNLGILCEGIQIFYPLTPLLALCFCDPFHYHRYPDKMTTKNVDNVIFQNSMQVLWSTRLIFSQDKDFSLVRRMLKEQPTFADVNRKRMSVS